LEKILFRVSVYTEKKWDKLQLSVFLRFDEYFFFNPNNHACASVFEITNKLN